jgi:hypothetical protein
MVYEAEPMQQPIRKAVGRPPTPRLRLWRIEQLGSFVRKFAHEALTRTEPDAFRVRKAVGRPRAQRR